jgi:pimeloyl-ACP methyl ester carboxylesterase
MEKNETNRSAVRFSLSIIITVMLLASSASSFAQSDTAASIPSKTGYAPVNGLKLYYEIHGKGEPLILLHGGLGAIEMFGANLTALAKNHRVIAVDLQGHGRTADIDRPLSIESMADDIAALINFLGIKKADIAGYSLGGEVAIQTVIRHPEIVRKLVAVSATFSRDGWYPGILSAQEQIGPATAEFMKQTPMYKLYAQIAPKVEDWPVIITKIGKLLKLDYNWSEGVKAIKVPVLLIVGDADAVRTAHAVDFFGLLGGGQHDGGWDGSGKPNSQLAILPGLTHYNIFMSPVLASTIIPFLDAPMPKTN